MNAKRFLISLTVGALSLAVAFAQSPKTKHRLTVVDYRATFEKSLGKPVSTKTVDGALVCRYSFKGSRGVQVTYSPRGGGLPPTVTTNVRVFFGQGTTWDQAIRAVGFDPAKMKPVKSYFPGYRQIVGDPVKNWNVFFVDPGAKYPDGGLINEDGGLPMLEFSGRELGDKSPD